MGGSVARALVISSYVAQGSVGLRATMAALAGRGIDVIALPTITLSCHPGHAHFAGAVVPIATLDDMLNALDANGALAGVDAVLTGYLPSEAHVMFAQSAIDRVMAQNSNAFVMVDPVLGDDPDGLYIDASAAKAVRDVLVPVAHILTPNRFELAYLSGTAIDCENDAVDAARTLGVARVAVTSVPFGPTKLANVLVTSEWVLRTEATKVDHAAHGTGDVFAAILLARLLEGTDEKSALASAAAIVAHAIAISGDAPDLALERVDWTSQDVTHVSPERLT
ncbi:MAG: pyridoxal kinase [Hyphomicrobium sp.]|nr:MAG: pyridoxal kinase [Hyphomicrobium sp.]PPD00517.1 MAG: pyridoxal kinase [Hyphomicrobium sp.]